MKAAIRTSRRGTRSASRPRSTSGKVVVAPSSTALEGADRRLGGDGREDRQAGLVDRQRPELDAAPPARTNGTKTATNSTSGSTTRTRRQSVRGGTRATAAYGRERPRAHATYTGQRSSGVETATTVTPSRPTIFARGSSRWAGLRGIAGEPGQLQRVVAEPAHAARRSARGRARPPA